MTDALTAETFEELVERAKDADADVRRIAAARLQHLEDTRAIPVLIGLMDDPTAGVRATAALGLGHVEAAEARSVLIDHLKNDESGAVRGICAHQLGAIGGADEEIIRALSDKDHDVKTSAITTIQCYAISSAAGKILELFDDEDWGTQEWSVRYFACCALIEFEVADKRIAEALTELRELPEAREQVQAFADADVFFEAIALFEDEMEQFEEDTPAEEIVRVLRERHGEDSIPWPSKDPLGDLIARAKQLCSPQY